MEMLDMDIPVYHRLAGGEVYDPLSGQFLSLVDTFLLPVEDFLVRNDGKGNKEWGDRARYRKFLEQMIGYGYPYIIGPELRTAEDEVKNIRAELAKLDAEYLTLRTLAGLHTGDEYAAARYAEHESKAAPLRERQSELTDIIKRGAA